MITNSKWKAAQKWATITMKKRYINDRSNSHGFIKNKSIMKDLDELKELIK